MDDRDEVGRRRTNVQEVPNHADSQERIDMDPPRTDEIPAADDVEAGTQRFGSGVKSGPSRQEGA